MCPWTWGLPQRVPELNDLVVYVKILNSEQCMAHRMLSINVSYYVFSLCTNVLFLYYHYFNAHNSNLFFSLQRTALFVFWQSHSRNMSIYQGVHQPVTVSLLVGAGGWAGEIMKTHFLCVYFLKWENCRSYFDPFLLFNVSLSYTCLLQKIQKIIQQKKQKFSTTQEMTDKCVLKRVYKQMAF